MMKITEWEHRDLLDYLNLASCWMRSEDDPCFWMRSDDRGTDLYAVRFSPGSPVVDVQIISIAASPDAAELSFKRVLEHRTAYARRAREQGLLEQELGHDSSTAEIIGIALEAVANGGSASTNEQQEDCLRQPVLIPDADVHGSVHVGTWNIAGGGFVRLELQQGQLLASLSLPSADGDGYAGLLRGFVHPVSGCGCAVGMAAALAGWDYEPSSDIGEVSRAD
jgi:hypothetical protein